MEMVWSEELGVEVSLFLIHSMNSSMTGSSTKGRGVELMEWACLLERHKILEWLGLLKWL